ncbi:PREDICTED: exonuclease GOR-like [Bactrocera latifrons]|uniref:exonuclease GOR-like n=1 Tax=Bactrocera latifrons TaxID=174628 RepID=UPI0008DE71F9|nr:PREDICTED: exonuclease GOR-like [Bactrocera latifrons]
MSQLQLQAVYLSQILHDVRPLFHYIIRPLLRAAVLVMTFCDLAPKTLDHRVFTFINVNRRQKRLPSKQLQELIQLKKRRQAELKKEQEIREKLEKKKSKEQKLGDQKLKEKQELEGKRLLQKKKRLDTLKQQRELKRQQQREKKCRQQELRRKYELKLMQKQQFIEQLEDEDFLGNQQVILEAQSEKIEDIETDVTPLLQFAKPNLSETEFVKHLQRYIMEPGLLRLYGYPTESTTHEGCIEIFKYIPHQFGLRGSNSSESENSSSSRSPSRSSNSGDSYSTATDCDSTETSEDEEDVFEETKKICARCGRLFHVTDCFEYVSHKSCTFHWGKLNGTYSKGGYTTQYTCCAGAKDSEGCERHSQHVWSGVVNGINGPYSDFVHTLPRAGKTAGASKVYALDCEMCYTERGLEVTKVTIVGYDGQVVYDHFVRPTDKIVDYNTRFSGVTASDLCKNKNKNLKTLKEVQKDLLQLIDADAILIGHGLENDLRALKIVHKKVIDTAYEFPHPLGFPYRRSLKSLTKKYLKREIQCGNEGHDSLEDTQACLELMMWKVRKYIDLA